MLGELHSGMSYGAFDCEFRVNESICIKLSLKET